MGETSKDLHIPQARPGSRRGGLGLLPAARRLGGLDGLADLVARVVVVQRYVRAAVSA